MSYKLVSITKASDGIHKLNAKFINKDTGREKNTKFGAVGYTDFTKGATEEQKKAYITRHTKNENWSNATSAGALSRYILWNKKSVSASTADYKKKFSV
jgi:hypothetical protein|tara:strand:+ start:4045 stop:4341 length:297 start_codon:yes stop_codon:yes gene_type:complete